MYYAKDGKAIDLLEWAKLFEDRQYKVIKQTTLGEYMVSTVWLGLDHQLGEGAPLFFETMVFKTKPDPNTGIKDVVGDGERYSTIYEAEEGHQRNVEKFKKIILDEFVAAKVSKAIKKFIKGKK